MDFEEPKKQASALTWVQNYLARRSHSEKELLEKLLKKDFEEQEILGAIDYAKQRKWLESSEELAEKVYKEWDKKHKSHSWICSYLQEKGLPSVRSKAPPREAEKAAYHLSKKFGIIHESNYKKASSNIASKGFHYEDFAAALELIKKEDLLNE